MRADIHDGPERTLQSEAGYIDARPYCRIDENLLHRTAGPYIGSGAEGSLGANLVWLGRIEARTGLRMMPTFPRSPLSFRTAGFPRYGWKGGISDGAFLDGPVA
jgi:hypothetical protein